MNYVSIEGPLSAIDNIHSVPEVNARRRSANKTGPDQWKINAYCPAEAVDELRALGLTVTVIKDTDEINDHFSSLEDDSDGTAIV